MKQSAAKLGVPPGPTGELMDRAEPRAAEADAGDLWRILWSRRAWILGVTLLCLALAGLYTVLVAPKYAATAQILIDPRDRQIVGKDVNPDTLAADGGLLEVESQARIIESDAVLLRAIAATGLATDPDYGAPKRSLVGDMMALLDQLIGPPSVATPDAARNRALRVLRKNLTIKRADKVFVVDVMVSAKSAAKAASISNAIAEAYVADQIEARSNASTDASAALGGTLAKLRDGVSEAELQVARYKAAHDLIGTDRQSLSDQQLEDSSSKLANAKAKSAELRARLDQIEAVRSRGLDIEAIPEALQSTVITQLRGSYQALLRRESDLRTSLGARHPDMISVEDQIKEARRQIAAELARLAKSARIDYERSLTYDGSLTAVFDRSKQNTLSAAESSVELHELNRELDARRSLYQAFLARSAETKAQAGIDTLNARIISKAIPPDEPSWPTRGFILLGSLAGGLGLGAALSLVLEYLAPRILSVGRLAYLTDAPVIGVLTARRVTGRTLRDRLWPAVRGHSAKPDDRVALALGRLCGPLGALREKSDPVTLLVTSAQNDDTARREVCDRLVAVGAEQGLAALLVEADLSAKRDAHQGFLDVLRDECQLASATLAASDAGAKRLRIGTAQRLSAEDLGRQNLDRFLRKASRSYDLIVFDAGAFETNARMAPLAALVDDVALVAVQGVTQERAVTGVADAIAAMAGRPVSAALLFQPTKRA